MSRTDTQSTDTQEKRQTKNGLHSMLRDDERGISEVYGTLLIISLAFTTAILLVGLGFYVIGDTTDEFEEGVSEDAMYETADRLDQLQVATDDDAVTEVLFPDESEGHLDTAQWSLEVTVESQNEELVGPEGPNSVENEFLSIVHETGDGDVMVYEGGALWEPSAGELTTTDQPLDDSGDSLEFSIAGLSADSNLRAGQELTATRNLEESESIQEEVNEIIEEYSQVEDNGDVIGTAPVDVTVSIESEFIEGWENYASENLDASIDDEDDSITLSFEDIGTEFPLETSPEDFHENVIYSGISDYAEYNTEISEAQDNGMEIAPGRYTVGVYNPNEEEWTVETGASGFSDEYPLSVDDDTYESEEGVLLCVQSQQPGQWTDDDCLGDENDDDDQSLLGVPNNDTDSLSTGHFQVEEVTVEDNEVSVGDNLDVKADITNTGPWPDEQDIVLGFDGNLVEIEDNIQIDPDEDETVEFEWETTPAQVDFDDDGEATGEVVVDGTGSSTSDSSDEVTITAD